MWTDVRNASLLHLLLLSVLILSPSASQHLRWVLYMQSISVVKLLPVCGDSAVNPPAAWICHVSEHVVISRYIFCAAYFPPFTQAHQAERFQNVCRRFIENLTYKYALAPNQCIIHFWLSCQITDFTHHLSMIDMVLIMNVKYDRILYVCQCLSFKENTDWHLQKD